MQAGNLQLSDMDLVEINEAFAAQFLSCAKELGLDMDKSNVNGTSYLLDVLNGGLASQNSARTYRHSVGRHMSDAQPPLYCCCCCCLGTRSN